MILVLAVAICGSFPSDAYAGKVLKGTLSGVVVDQNGKPVSNTQVYVYQRDWTNTDGLGQPDWKTLAGTALTARNGQYKIALPAGEYRVMFVPQNLDSYAMEAYPDAPIVRLGDSITIRYGKTTGGISAKLDTPGQISGYVYDTYPGREGQPMVDLPMSICHQELSYINCFQLVSTDENGYYIFKGLKPYPWQMWVNCPMFALPGSTEPYDVPNYKPDYKGYFTTLNGQFSWLPAAGQNVERAPVLLEYNEFVNISGRLVYFDEVNQVNKPAVGVTVWAQFADMPDDPGNSDWGGDYLQATTDQNGEFQMRDFNQDHGVFILYTDGNVGNEQPYLDEYFDNSYDQWGAEQIDISQGHPVDIGEWMIDLNPDNE